MADAKTSEFKASTRQRATVLRLAGYGLTDEQIAFALETSEATLKRHCADELRRGRSGVLQKVAGNLARRALKGDRTCMIFFLKCRGGWRERMELTGPNGTPLGGTSDAKQRLGDRLARLAAGAAAGGSAGKPAVGPER